MAIVETDREVEVLKARVAALEGREWALLDAVSEDIARYKARVRELEGILADQGRCYFLHGSSETHDEQAVRAMQGHARREQRLEGLSAALRLNAKLRDKLAALEEAMRWRPIAEWDAEFPKELNAREVATHTNPRLRRVVPAGMPLDRLLVECWTHFRPVLPGPEGA